LSEELPHHPSTQRKCSFDKIINTRHLSDFGVTYQGTIVFERALAEEKALTPIQCGRYRHDPNNAAT
jgi:hypothetical protein